LSTPLGQATPKPSPAREAQTYFKSDRITGSFELRRITTNPWRGAASRGELGQ